MTWAALYPPLSPKGEIAVNPFTLEVLEQCPAPGQCGTWGNVGAISSVPGTLEQVEQKFMRTG